jgi:cyclic pyranopterin phosphate synthase
MLLDLFGRSTYNLRVSVTSKCNLKCIFCHKEGDHVGGVEFPPKILEEVVKLVASYGVSKVKITGGEPLTRKDIVEIINRFSSIPEVREVSLVTNASLLEPLAHRLAKAGLDRINVNIPSLNPKKYHKLTNGSLEDVLKGVNEAVRYIPIKINMVLLKDTNEEELEEYLQFASDTGTQLQIIELEPIRIKKGLYSKMHVKPSKIEKILQKRSIKTMTRETMQKRKIYDLGNILVEVVHPVENTEFCAFCNRIRLGNDGSFKPCLMRNDNKVYITDVLKNNDVYGLTKSYVRSITNREPFYADF